MIRAPGLLITGWRPPHNLQLILTSWPRVLYGPARGGEASSRPNRPAGLVHGDSSQCGTELAGNISGATPRERVQPGGASGGDIAW